MSRKARCGLVALHRIALPRPPSRQQKCPASSSGFIFSGRGGAAGGRETTWHCVRLEANAMIFDPPARRGIAACISRHSKTLSARPFRSPYRGPDLIGIGGARPARPGTARIHHVEGGKPTLLESPSPAGGLACACVARTGLVRPGCVDAVVVLQLVSSPTAAGTTRPGVPPRSANPVRSSHHPDTRSQLPSGWGGRPRPASPDSLRRPESCRSAGRRGAQWDWGCCCCSALAQRSVLGDRGG